jgi:two-component system, sensor histidine kinase and response regulator
MIQSLEALTEESPIQETPATQAPPHATVGALGTKALDRAAIMERMGDDTELLKELIRMFDADSPKLLSDILDAIAQSDGQGLERAAHTLRGAVSNFDVGEAYDATLWLERIGKSGNLQEADTAYQLLEKAVDGLRPQLTSLMEETV